MDTISITSFPLFWMYLMLKIKQTYHGTGGREGYRFRVYKNNRIIGELVNLPSPLGQGSIIMLNNQLYKITKKYEPFKPYSKLETVWYELEEYTFTDYEILEWK